MLFTNLLLALSLLSIKTVFATRNDTVRRSQRLNSTTLPTALASRKRKTLILPDPNSKLMRLYKIMESSINSNCKPSDGVFAAPRVDNSINAESHTVMTNEALITHHDDLELLSHQHISSAVTALDTRIDEINRWNEKDFADYSAGLKHVYRESHHATNLHRINSDHDQKLAQIQSEIILKRTEIDEWFIERQKTLANMIKEKNHQREQATIVNEEEKLRMPKKTVLLKNAARSELIRLPKLESERLPKSNPLFSSYDDQQAKETSLQNSLPQDMTFETLSAFPQPPSTQPSLGPNVESRVELDSEEEELLQSQVARRMRSEGFAAPSTLKDDRLEEELYRRYRHALLGEERGIFIARKKEHFRRFGAY